MRTFKTLKNGVKEERKPESILAYCMHELDAKSFDASVFHVVSIVNVIAMFFLIDPFL